MGSTKFIKFLVHNSKEMLKLQFITTDYYYKVTFFKKIMKAQWIQKTIFWLPVLLREKFHVKIM